MFSISPVRMITLWESVGEMWIKLKGLARV